MDNDTEKYYTDNGNDRPYWIGEKYYNTKKNTDTLILDFEKDKYYTDNANDRPYWIGEKYYGKNKN